ncbi:hypothetical protein ERHA55_04210 [Erwinia rhapontici]|nr:hypothetical protein ERHA55_04210 [Erwinia rhapontici]
MDPTSSNPINFSPLTDNAFRPLMGTSNPHLQTILPRLIRRRITLQPHWQRLTLPDSDFVDLAWSEDPAAARHKPEWSCSTGWRAVFTALMRTACFRRGKIAAGLAW